MEHEKPGGGVQGSPVLATEDEFVAPAMEAAGERGAAEQMGGVIGVVSGPDGEADELAAVEVEDPEKKGSLSVGRTRQTGHVSAPDLARLRRLLRRRGLRVAVGACVRTAMMDSLMCVQHALEA